MSGKVNIMIVGAGGHAKVIVDTLRRNALEVAGLTDCNFSRLGYTSVLGAPVLGDDSEIQKFDPDRVELVNGLAGIRDTKSRDQVFSRFKAAGYRFRQVIHPSAVIAEDCELGEGVQVMAGVVIQPGSRIGDNTLINTGAKVDHDCTIGKNVHVTPGVTLSGGVVLGDGVHVGTGASVIQRIVVGKSSTVAAGAVVVADVPEGAFVKGVPARLVQDD